MSEFHEILVNNLKNEPFFNYLKAEKSNSIIYNLDLLDQLSKYYQKKAHNNGLKILYSIKANMNVPILKVLAKHVDGFDCASIYEYRIAKSINPKSIYLTGNSFLEQDLKMIDYSKTYLDCSTLNQLLAIHRLNSKLKVGLRFRGDSDFGVSEDTIRKNINSMKYVTRMHFHGVSFESMYENIELFARLMDKNNIKIINFGGGVAAIKLLYSNDARTLKFIKKVKAIFPKAILMIEPGQLFVAAVGFLSTKVIDICESIPILNTSAFNLSSWYVPKLLYPKLKKGNNKIMGNTNWKDDIFITDIRTHDINIGDTLIFGFVGAYYATTKRTLHGLPFPKELYFQNNKIIDQ